MPNYRICHRILIPLNVPLCIMRVTTHSLVMINSHFYVRWNCIQGVVGLRLPEVYRGDGVSILSLDKRSRLGKARQSPFSSPLPRYYLLSSLSLHSGQPVPSHKHC